MAGAAAAKAGAEVRSSARHLFLRASSIVPTRMPSPSDISTVLSYACLQPSVYETPETLNTALGTTEAFFGLLEPIWALCRGS